MNQITLGVIVSNREFFPDILVSEGRKEILRVLEEMNISPVILGEDETPLGAVMTWEDAKRCGELFSQNRRKIDGILVTLPNFGDEKAVSDAIKLSGLQVPVLVQAFPDDMKKMFVERRRDSFCGKMSVCNNFDQYRIPFSLTELHTVQPDSTSFKKDLDWFVRVCRVVKGMRTARLGAVGARPNAFNTVRFSEKLLQGYGISVSTVDFSEIIGLAERLTPEDAMVKDRLEAIRTYIPTKGVPSASVIRMAKLAVVLDKWMLENELTATALQCWSSIQKNYGVNVCTLMSMMSDRLMPSACETDITGVASMYALQLASDTPSALVDWNNNYEDDPDKCVLFHCGNWAKSFYSDFKMAYADILATTIGKEITYGAIAGRVPAGPMSYARISTKDQEGKILAYVGDGQFTDDPLETFGSTAVVQVPELQKLLKYICKNGFEHHVAMNGAITASVLAEAFGNYLGWEVYWHQA